MLSIFIHFTVPVDKVPISNALSHINECIEVAQVVHRCISIGDSDISGIPEGTLVPASSAIGFKP
jgi:hypothetical protein